MCSLWCLGKCFLTNFRNTFPILVFMLWLNGGLNHSFLPCLLLLFVFSLVSYFISTYLSCLYKTEIHVENDYKSYYGAVEGEFKFKYNNHTKSFRNRHHEHDTELSKYIWKLKDLGKTFTLKWSIAAYASPYWCGTRPCDLCLTEKYIIARGDQERLLNKQNCFPNVAIETNLSWKTSNNDI